MPSACRSGFPSLDWLGLKGSDRKIVEEGIVHTRGELLCHEDDHSMSWFELMVTCQWVHACWRLSRPTTCSLAGMVGYTNLTIAWIGAINDQSTTVYIYTNHSICLLNDVIYLPPVYIFFCFDFYPPSCGPTPWMNIFQYSLWSKQSKWTISCAKNWLPKLKCGGDDSDHVVVMSRGNYSKNIEMKKKKKKIKLVSSHFFSKLECGLADGWG